MIRERIRNFNALLPFYTDDTLGERSTKALRETPPPLYPDLPGSNPALYNGHRHKKGQVSCLWEV